MDFGYWKTPLISFLFVLIFHSAWSTNLSAPKLKEVSSSVLSWEPSKVNNVTYTVQYRADPGQEWHYLCGCNQPQFSFADGDFYGKIFRVRAERGNQTTVWQESVKIQCRHTDACAPLLNLTIKNYKVLLWMDDKDETLKKEFGGHITFRALYWKETSASDKQELDASGKTLLIEELEAGQKYCFNVVYVVYNKPYGSPSRVLCEVIPETPTVQNLRIIISGVLINAGLMVFGCCLYFVYKNYKRIKTFLQPPLDIPEHIEEFFSGEFPHHEFVCIGSEELESNGLITLVPEQIREEEEGGSDGRENSISPDIAK
ncbi:interferon gamma receptor 2 precursor [Pygocentrus nattereri]|uniref:Interferon/interleukin receptor domain-containing protein n=1 Tax=Pygocentrus nattereri TaxID=42514 RepID=A0AAR2M0C9_PYGNA|nr:interferon gamma receptor 2 precursor [Pygocentrus nattereri]